MAWIDENWKQDETVFSGYPTPLEAPEPVAFDKANSPTLWKFGTALDGYPYIPTPERFSKKTAPTLWKFDNHFYGYPHIPEPADYTPQSNYTPHLTGFSTNGLGADFKLKFNSQEIALPDVEKISFQRPETVHFTFQLPEVKTL